MSEEFDYYAGDGIEESVEMTEEHWDIIYRRAARNNQDLRDGYREFHQAPAIQDHDARDAIVIVIVTTIIAIAVVVGALAILTVR